MTVYRYCTPEWLDACAAFYRSTAKFPEAFAKLSTTVVFRALREPGWGIDKDILYGASVDKGDLKALQFYSESEAQEKADFIMAAAPGEWKRLIRHEGKFTGDLMVGRISIEKGNKLGVLQLAPYSNTFIEALTPGELQFPDEMSASELESFRSYVADFRQKLSV
jgi:hypothetical protein